ncbi:MAG: CPBP family intramembrane metalloprotease [Chloroflexi bacterium]|nr:CPBP family intramembrane metalloprotease [Chloroflexota bacterium]
MIKTEIKLEINTTILDWLRASPFWVHVAITWSLLTLFMLVVRVAPWLRSAGQSFYSGLGLPSSEARFLTEFTFVAWAAGLGLVLNLWLVVRLEQPTDWKALFLLQRTDWRGFLILFGIQIMIFGLEMTFLQKGLWKPIQDWLIGLGAWTEPGLLAPPREYLWLNLIALTLMSWVEMPEEIYFRGYLQSQITKRIGAFWGIVLSNLLWDLWHVWNPAMFVRRFVINLPLGILVHLRGRVWGPMIAHPLGNRLNALLLLLGQ